MVQELLIASFESLRSKLQQFLRECNGLLFLEGDVSSVSLAEKQMTSALPIIDPDILF